jgi:transcriptional regulator with XRE-family HTH domain
MSQRDFSSILGFPQQTYQGWEADSASVDYPTAFWIAHKLEIPIDKLWSGSLGLNASKFILPPEDIEAMKPLIESVRTIRSQWGKRSTAGKEEIKNHIQQIMEEGSSSEEDIQKVLNYLEKKGLI